MLHYAHITQQTVGSADPAIFGGNAANFYPLHLALLLSQIASFLCADEVVGALVSTPPGEGQVYWRGHARQPGSATSVIPVEL